jgi:predicted enzyme related to lactoylglutathione lyase
MSTQTMFPPGVPCWVAQLNPESDEAKQFYAAIFDWTLDNIAPLAANQALRSDRYASGADRNSRASLLEGCYDPSATPFAFLTANGSVSL